MVTPSPSHSAEPPVEAPSQRREGASHPLHLRALWLLAPVPLFVIALLIQQFRPPSEAQAHLVDLSGTWQVRLAPADRSRPSFADTARTRTVKLPGTLGVQGVHAHRVWLERSFDFPGARADREHFLLLGNFGTGAGRIALNGRWIGASDPFARGLKAHRYGLEGWLVPAGVVRTEGNTITVRIDTRVPDDSGIRDPRMYLGERTVVEPYFIRDSDVTRLAEQGALASSVCVMLVVLMLLALEGGARREVYKATLLAVGSSLAYLAVNGSGVLPLAEPTPFGAATAFGAAIVVAVGLVTFVEAYLLGGRTRFGQVCQWFWAAVLAVFGVLALLGHAAAIATVYYAIVPMLGLMVLYIVAVSVRAAIHRTSPSAPFLAYTISLVGATAVVDMLADLSLIQIPRLFPVTIANVVVIAAVVVIADFVGISVANRKLTESLSKTNAELARALGAANEAVQARSQFVANVSHELRTPLNAIINIPVALLRDFDRISAARCRACNALFELSEGDAIDATTPCPDCHAPGTLAPDTDVRFGGDPGELATFLRTIERSGRHLLQLINGVLTFSKIEADRMTLALESFDATALVHDVLEMVRPLATEKGIALETHLPEGTLTLRADPVKITQVLINLLGNALKFSPPGARVQVLLRREGDYGVMGVKDDGPGIAEEHQELIFESFRQVQTGHTRTHGGTGLGLAITRHLVAMHEGSIRLESRVGAGALFEVWLPIAGPTGMASVRTSHEAERVVRTESSEPSEPSEPSPQATRSDEVQERMP